MNPKSRGNTDVGITFESQASLQWWEVRNNRWPKYKHSDASWRANWTVVWEKQDLNHTPNPSFWAFGWKKCRLVIRPEHWRLPAVRSWSLANLPELHFLLHKLGIIASISWGYSKDSKAQTSSTHTIYIVTYSTYLLKAGLKNATGDPSGSCSITPSKEKKVLPFISADLQQS